MDELTRVVMIALSAFVVIPLVIHSFMRVERNERMAIRAQYAELIKEKLEVIKTALAMGRGDADIAELDRRLERLVGTETMLEKLKVPTDKVVAEARYMQTKDLVDELDQKQAEREKEQHS